MKTVELKTTMANCLGDVTYLDQSGLSKTIISHVTQQGKQILINRKLCNFAPHFLPVCGHTMTSYT